MLQLTAVLLVRSVLAVGVSVAVPVLSDAAAVGAAELLVRTFTHVCHGNKEGENMNARLYGHALAC